MNPEKSRRRPWRRELEASWEFEAAEGGTSLFYPHGWGLAYVVPTEEKRREIEEFLARWLKTVRTTMKLSQAFAVLLAAILLASILPPFCRIVWYVPVWHEIFTAAPFALALDCLLVVGSPLTLRFLAETAKADLEKARTRRPFGWWLKEQARRYNPRLLWTHGALFTLALAEGVWLLWPRQRTVMTAAHVDPRLLPFGIGLIAFASAGILFKTWQIRTKLNS